jgi:putative transposase
MIREDAAMPISRFCTIIGIPRRTYFRRLAFFRAGESPERKSRSAPTIEACVSIVATYISRWPEYGHRRLHALMTADGHVTSASTVLRAMRLLQGTQTAPP